jgi:hypothetical protein
VKLFEDEETKQLMKKINQSENYLKGRFKTHCERNSAYITHCIDFALSNPNDKELQSKCENEHSSICDECLNLVHSIDFLKLKLNHLQDGHEKEVAQFEVSNAEAKILEWQRHIVRGVQQSKSRSNAFSSIGPTNALWIRDFAQKYNPNKVNTIICIIGLKCFSEGFRINE